MLHVSVEMVGAKSQFNVTFMPLASTFQELLIYVSICAILFLFLFSFFIIFTILLYLCIFFLFIIFLFSLLLSFYCHFLPILMSFTFFFCPYSFIFIYGKNYKMNNEIVKPINSNKCQEKPPICWSLLALRTLENVKANITNIRNWNIENIRNVMYIRKIGKKQ